MMIMVGMRQTLHDAITRTLAAKIHAKAFGRRGCVISVRRFVWNLEVVHVDAMEQTGGEECLGARDDSFDEIVLVGVCWSFLSPATTTSTTQRLAIGFVFGELHEQQQRCCSIELLAHTKFQMEQTVFD